MSFNLHRSKKMNTKQELGIFNRYKHYAEKAARIERAGNYPEAVKLWETAMLNANDKQKKQYEWAKASADFCRRMILKPFRGE